MHILPISHFYDGVPPLGRESEEFCGCASRTKPTALHHKLHWASTQNLIYRIRHTVFVFNGKTIGPWSHVRASTI